MAPTLISYLAIIQEYLATDDTLHRETGGSTVYDYTSGNVFVGQTPEDYSGKTTQGILVRPEGGETEPHDSTIVRASVSVWSYAGSDNDSDAWTLARAVTDRCNGMPKTATASGTILGAIETSAPILAMDPGTRERYALAIYDFLVMATN